MFIKNTWYVAGWSEEVSQCRFFSRTIIGTPIVMYRADDESLIALQDRCCHRGAPLSMGRQEGDCVRCLYHGLKFDRSGVCIEAPPQEKIPLRAKGRSFPVVERHRLIWIWMGDPRRAEPAAIPDMHWLHDPGWRSESGYLRYAVNYLLICDNLLDFSHLPFVHPETLGGSEDYVKVEPKIDVMNNGVRIERWTMNTDVPPFAAKLKKWPGKVDRWNIYEFTIPGVLRMDSGMAPVDTGARQGVRIDAAEFRGCQAVTPETECSTHYFWSNPHNFAINDPAVTRSIHQSVMDAFNEDRAIIEAQQRNLNLDLAFTTTTFGVDSALLAFRKLVNERLTSELTQTVD